jgi:prepilin-type N-terminal cleavage/methylation domain-containing protein
MMNPRPAQFGSPAAQRRSAFTLIELLVVVAIISLLVSILLPSLTRAKMLARQVVCATNLKAWGPAILMYAEDNSGTMIARAGPPVTDGWDRWMSHWWAERRNHLVDNYGLAKAKAVRPACLGDTFTFPAIGKSARGTAETAAISGRSEPSGM